MLTPRYRIESSGTLRNDLLRSINLNHLYHDSSLAVAVAVKSVTDPERDEVRVVQVPGGEIIFSSATPQ